MNRVPRSIARAALLAASAPALLAVSAPALLAISVPALAQTAAEGQAQAPAPAQTAPPADRPAAAQPAAQPSADSAAWDAALGLLGTIRPQYPGSPRRVFKTTPSFYLRYGRYIVTNASSLAPRRSEDVVRGLGFEMVESDKLRASVSLRYDSGRSEHSAAAYEGLGKIPHTVRARLAASWQLQGPWRLGASWNPDVLGRGNGAISDVSLGWDRRLTPQTSLSVGSALSFGDRRYMQAYYGVDEMQSQRSGYATFRALPGLRDVGISANLRHDIGRDWIFLASTSANRLLGSAARSPITRETRGYGIGGGVARQF